jgi:hypothetical protein
MRFTKELILICLITLSSNVFAQQLYQFCGKVKETHMGANPSYPVANEDIFGDIGIFPGTKMCYTILINQSREGFLISHEGETINKPTSFYIELQNTLLASKANPEMWTAIVDFYTGYNTSTEGGGLLALGNENHGLSCRNEQQLPFNEWRVGTKITCLESISYTLDAIPTIVYNFTLSAIVETKSLQRPAYGFRMVSDLMEFSADAFSKR